MTFEQSLCIGLAVASTAGFFSVLAQFVIAYLQRRNEQKKYFREKLLDRYSEFFSEAAKDLERAKDEHSTIAHGGKYPEGMESLDSARKTSRVQLLRLSFWVWLVERDPILCNKIEKLANSQPFMALRVPVEWGQVGYQKRFDKFKEDINTFEQEIISIIDLIRSRHPE
ncbi:hypothetical protein [Zavarzinella formosa]|uniref:hypothetical protein n=1 Tax=Zavarzinella formosa TaxID=360055 RepID=UPI00037FE45D|nr:hypothetical protein [Zavarzinella formosa]